jgi:hypothetical protein
MNTMPAPAVVSRWTAPMGDRRLVVMVSMAAFRG